MSRRKEYMYSYRWMDNGRAVGKPCAVRTDLRERRIVESMLIVKATPPVYWPDARPLITQRDTVVG